MKIKRSQIKHLISNILLEASKDNPSGYKYKTKDGKKIRFKAQANFEDRGLNRGWILHKIDAYVDDRLAGYIKISYIPKRNLEEQYPTVWHYKGMRGWTGMDPTYGGHADAKTPDERRNFSSQLDADTVIGMYL